MRGFFEGFEKRAGLVDNIRKGVGAFVSESGRQGRAVSQIGRAAEEGMGAAANRLKGTKAEDLLRKGQAIVNKGRKDYTKALKHNAQTVREGKDIATRGVDFLKQTADRYRKAGL